MKIKSLDEIEYKLIKNNDDNKRNIRLYEFNNVIITGNSQYYPDCLLKTENDLILPVKEMSMSLNKKSYYEENGMEYYFQNKIKHEYIKEEVYYFIYNTENYYHFIYDTLPYLYLFLKIRENNSNIKLLINYNKNEDKLLPFVEESLEILGIKKKNILIHKENQKYYKMYLSNSLTHDGKSNSPPRKEIFDIYKLMVNNVIENSSQNNIVFDKIYISRRTWLNKKNKNIGTDYTTRRKMVNEDELVENLKKKDFQEIFGENYSMKEKILIFYNAKIIIGAIGGTITNCIFCNHNCKIITIVSPDFLNINYRMKFLFNENVLLFNDTYLYCKSNEISKNVRILITDKNHKLKGSIGEIISKNNNDYSVRLGNNYISFNNRDDYQNLLLNEKQFKKLDNGLNSPYKININRLENLLYKNPII